MTKHTLIPRPAYEPKSPKSPEPLHSRVSVFFVLIIAMTFPCIFDAFSFCLQSSLHV